MQLACYTTELDFYKVREKLCKIGFSSTMLPIQMMNPSTLFAIVLKIQSVVWNIRSLNIFHFGGNLKKNDFFDQNIESAVFAIIIIQRQMKA